MAGGNPYDPACFADVRQTQRPRLADEHAEDAASPRQVADRPVGLVVDADGEKPLERRSLLVEHPERRVARARELASRVEHVLEHRLEVELRDERAAGVDEPFEPVLASSGRAESGRPIPSM